MKIRNSVKEALRAGRPTLGSWIQIGHPMSAEVLSRVGFEWLAVDCEHTDIDVAQASNLFRGMSPNCIPIVRVAENDTLRIRQVLDAGARGIIVPMVNTAEQARNAVAAAKYPPAGVRGFGFSRANNYGRDFKDYIASANEDTIVIAQIEHIEGVRNIDSILEVEGIDGIFIGPYDLSGSLNIPGQLNDGRVVQAMQKLLQACALAGKPCGLHVVAPDEAAVRKAIQDGFTFIALSVDVLYMAKCAEQCFAAAQTAVDAVLASDNVSKGRIGQLT